MASGVVSHAVVPWVKGAKRSTCTEKIPAARVGSGASSARTTGSKRPPASSLQPWQVMLNGADGLDFQTAVDCGVFCLVSKDACSPAVGCVSLERRRQIGRRINEILRLPR